MKALEKLTSLIYSAWSPQHWRKSCALIVCCQIVVIVSLLFIGFIYVHIFLPEYNYKRLSKFPLVCSTIDNEWVEPDRCELPWDQTNITIEKHDRSRRLYENDAHSVTVSVHKVPSTSRSGLQQAAGTESEKLTENMTEVASERHFVWSSCGEFCSPSLVEEYGCRQLRANVRLLGSELNLVDCTKIEIIECPFLESSDDEQLSESTLDEIIKQNEKNVLQPPACSTLENKPCLKTGIFKCDYTEDSFYIIGRSASKLESISGTVETILINLTNATSANGTESVLSVVEASAAPTPIFVIQDKNGTSSSTEVTRLVSTEPSVLLIDNPKPSSQPLRSSLKCTHIESIVSCDMKKLDSEGVIKKLNCTDPSSPNCLQTPGIYVCDAESWCRQIKNPNNICTRTCGNIVGLDDKNVIVSDEKFRTIITAQCQKAFRGKEKVEVWPFGIKHKTDKKWRDFPPLLVICNYRKRGRSRVNVDPKDKNNRTDLTDFTLGDCFNGTRLENVSLPPLTTLKGLQSLWYLNMETKDYDLDAIDTLDAPPASKLTINISIQMYLNDFYKNDGEGCAAILAASGEKEKMNLDKCRRFNHTYGRVPGDLKGPSIFSCYCRNIDYLQGSWSFCVVGDMRGTEVFDYLWEDALVEFLEDHSTAMLTIFIIFLSVALIIICMLVYPLAADISPPTDSLPLTGVTPEGGNVRHGSPSLRSVSFIEDRRDALFAATGSPGRRNSVTKADVRRSRSNSIVSVMMN